MGGAPLKGAKVVRFIFLDEGGISRHEPIVVVAGAFVHGDEQLTPLEIALRQLVQKHIPKEDHSGFVFHAKDIWSGSKYFKDEEKWPLQKRLNILHDLARLPRKLDIPIVYEAVERAKIQFSGAEREPTPNEHSEGVHAVAFTSCTLRIEEFMRTLWPFEVAQMVAENNDQVRAALKGVHALLRDPTKSKGGLHSSNLLPLRQIRNSVHFASKDESGPLQLADLCAFIIRGHLTKHRHNPPLYDRIRSMLLRLPKNEIYAGPLITAAPPYVAIDFQQE
jgi:hypothetical protein